MMIANLVGAIVGILIGSFVSGSIIQIAIGILLKEKPKYWNAYKAAAVIGLASYFIGYAGGAVFGPGFVAIGFAFGFLVQVLILPYLIDLPSGNELSYGAATAVTLMQLAVAAAIFATIYAITVA